MLQLLALLATVPTYTVTRDAFGVPTISAKSAVDAYEGLGYAVAQDRECGVAGNEPSAHGGPLGRGPGLRRSLASDKDILTLGYTPQEVDAQVDALGKPAHDALDAYARGVNRYIEEATLAKSLPPGYAQFGFEPSPWTAHDSAAISIYLLRHFGRAAAQVNFAT